MQITPAPLSASTYENRGLLMTGGKKKKEREIPATQPPEQQQRRPSPLANQITLISSHLISSHLLPDTLRQRGPGAASSARGGGGAVGAGGARGALAPRSDAEGQPGGPGCRASPKPPAPRQEPRALSGSEGRGKMSSIFWGKPGLGMRKAGHLYSGKTGV